MTKMPINFQTEDGRNEREILARYFDRFKIEYQKSVAKSGYHLALFTLFKPFNMLLGTYKDRLYVAVSSDHALRGRTQIYTFVSGTYLDMEQLSVHSQLCGFGENTIIIDVSSTLYLNPDGPDVENEIAREAAEMVEFEIKNLERKHKIMRVNPIFGKHRFEINNKNVFMLMPFGDPALNEFYEDHIRPTILALEMHCIRADDIFSNQAIINDIWRNINEARIIIADLTHRNPNVFYEVGIAHTLGKDVILISQVENDIPFDLRHIRTIFYKNTTRGSLEFCEKLQETIRNILETNVTTNLSEMV
jgi:hypothetical protein